MYRAYHNCILYFSQCLPGSLWIQSAFLGVFNSIQSFLVRAAQNMKIKTGEEIQLLRSHHKTTWLHGRFPRQVWVLTLAGNRNLFREDGQFPFPSRHLKGFVVSGPIRETRGQRDTGRGTAEIRRYGQTGHIWVYYLDPHPIVSCQVKPNQTAPRMSRYLQSLMTSRFNFQGRPRWILRGSCCPRLSGQPWLEIAETFIK